MTSVSSLSICPSCKGENAVDSRFCRHCGQVLEGTSAAVSTAVSTAVSAAQPIAPAITIAEANGEGELLSSPDEIDGRRARQLLDRAQYLAERGDIGGAILASRQSIALAPLVSEGHSMLGQMLERSGDMAHAVTAYEKATQLAPDSLLEHENLARIREKLQEQHVDTQFRFDDAELFADAGAEDANGGIASAASVPESPVAPVVAAGVKEGLSPKVLQNGPDAADARSAKVATPVSASAARGAANPAANPVVFERRLSQRRRFNSPITVERRHNVERRVPVRAAQGVGVPAVIAPVVQAPLTVPATAPAGAWSHLWSRPSYFGRSLPLAGATVLALGLLSLARSGAVARAVDLQARTASSSALEPPTAPIAPPAETVVASNGLPPLAPVGAPRTLNDGFPITNRPVTSGPGAPATANSSQSSSANGSSDRSSANASTRSSAPPRVSAVPRASTRPRAATTPVRSLQIPPAAIPPAGPSSGSGSANRNSDPISLPAPNIPAPQVQTPPVNVLPSGSSPALNPAGASGRGYVRITQGRVGTSALPQRSGSQANTEERNAANASRNGQNDQAIDRLSAAINANASDAGYRYQQRAMLFLNRGDYSRAADDFQAAMNAYRAQIDRGEQVVAARAGLSSARSGLNLALAGGR